MGVETNTDEVIGQTEKARKTVGDLRPFGDEIANATRAEIKQIFDSEGRGLWPETKRRNRTGIRLQDTREYYRGATEQSHPGHIERITKNEVEIGVNLGHYRRLRGVPYPIIVENRFLVYGQIDDAFAESISDELDIVLQKELNKVFD